MSLIYLWVAVVGYLEPIDCKQDSFSSYNKVGIILFLVIRISYVFED